MNEREIFTAALNEHDPGNRAAFLETACADDPELRKRVESLLAEHADLGSFLERPAIDMPPISLIETESVSAYESELPLDFLLPSQKPGHLGRLGHYDVVEVIGRGGMGIVLKAIDDDLNRVVAVKVMAAALATSAIARKRFRREAQAAAAVSHDHVVTIHAVDEANGLPFLAMQYVSGVSLQQRLDKSGQLELREIVRIGMQMAAGLAAAHAQGLIHRDIKPANILLENGVERVKITDFGLARAVADASMTQSGIVAGTPQYMSPEQARGELVDRRSDLFSLGSVLYAMCTGRPPFRADSVVAALKRVCDDTPRPIREINPEIPQWLGEIVTRLHAKDPAQRYQSATEVAELLGKYLAHLQHPSVERLPAAKAPRSRARQRIGLGTIAATIALFCLIGLGLTEASGITRLSATMIRILTPEGTLIVDVDDPSVKVTIEGNGGIAITGSGFQEVRLKAGSYKVQAVKSGKPVRLDQELVTITRGDQRVVRVRLEGEVAAGIGVVEVGQDAFVVLAVGTERRFKSLAEAVIGASDGDTIEIRGNGPFVCEAISIKGRTHVIRAGAGFRPVLQFTENLNTNAPLVLEGLEFQRRDKKVAKGWEEALVFSWEGQSLDIANCRFLEALTDMPCVVANVQTCSLRNCQFLNPVGLGPCWTCQRRCVVENCLIAARQTVALQNYSGEHDREIDVRLARSTVLSAVGPVVDITVFPTVWPAKEGLKPIVAEVTHTILDTNVAVHVNGLDAPVPTESSLLPADLESRLRRVLSWRDQFNLFVSGSSSVSTHATAIGPKNLAQWKQFWGSADGDAVEGHIRYEGGDLTARLNAAPEKLMPEDFRLRPDSAGYHAGPEGKDLGADVDLVGPGPAYERWKKLPEYQQWLKDTNQLKPDSLKAERGAFVVLAAGKERRFPTLADAVRGATAGDIIEVRANGPFDSAPIRVTNGALAIRAGRGFRPIIRLDAKFEREPFLLHHDDPLVLEGLELQRESHDPNGRDSWRVIIDTFKASLNVANCRFLLKEVNSCIQAQSATLEVLNCEFICVHGGAISGDCTAGQRWHIENCVQAGGGCGLSDVGDELNEVSIRAVRNTMFDFHLVLNRETSLLNDGKLKFPVHIDVSKSVFDSWGSHLQFVQVQPNAVPLPEARAALRRIIGWQGAGNLYASNQLFLSTSIQWEELESATPIKSLADWQAFWGQEESGSSMGQVSYQGGNLIQKLHTTPEALVGEDFRLRSKSAGYRAGTDGKDIGADVDLVGPGPAYERWKKLPEYQQWLKDTNQLKPDSARAERGAFVVLGGKGVPERKHDTLAAAVLGASDGDTIEVRSDGPFICEPINNVGNALTIRAGSGFRPVIRLDREDETRRYLLQSNAPLILEGLEFQRETQGPPENIGWRAIINTMDSSLDAANCRFLLRGLHSCIHVHSPILRLRNCEFICIDGAAVNGQHFPGQSWSIENCALAGGHLSLNHEAIDHKGGSISLQYNTMLQAGFVYRQVDDLMSSKTGSAVRLDANANIFDKPLSQIGFEHPQLKPLSAADAEELLRKLIDWRGQSNLYALEQKFLHLSSNWQLITPPTRVTNLLAWKEFWDGAEVDSLEGRIRYQGGDLMAKVVALPEKMTPEDFRLRPDSAGYRAGPNGKDLGADIDFVGPGEAYERWKKSIEYQKWRLNTGQSRESSILAP